jgi:hypothetical protein
LPTLRKLTERACNDPQRMRARKTEAEIMEKMPSRAWLSCTAVSRLISALDDRKTRAWLDRLVRDGKSNASVSRAATARSICSGGFREQRPAGLGRRVFLWQGNFFSSAEFKVFCLHLGGAHAE